MWRSSFRYFRKRQVVALTPFADIGFGCVRSTAMIDRALRRAKMGNWQFNQRFNSGVQLLDVAETQVLGSAPAALLHYGPGAL